MCNTGERDFFVAQSSYNRKVAYQAVDKTKSLHEYPHFPHKEDLFRRSLANLSYSGHFPSNTKKNSLYHTVEYKNHSVGYIFHTVGHKSRTVKQRI